MGYVYKKTLKGGTPRYYAIYKQPDGKYRWEAAGRQKQAAEALLKRREMEIAAGTYGKLSEISFDDLVEKFLEEYVMIALKPRTQADYEQVCGKHLVPYFGKVMVSSISTAEIQSLVKAKLSEGLSARTVNKILSILSKIFVQAIKWGFVDGNPVANVDHPREEKKEMDFLSPHEVKMLLDACPPDFYPRVLCAVTTGMREGEQAALINEDVDLDGNRIHISRSFSGGHLTSPKSFRSRRTVLITPVLSKTLAELKLKTGAKPTDLVFPGDDGGYMSPHVLSRRFEKVLKAAGLRTITWHSLRHTYAALMISLGENLVFIQRQMGHSSIRTTLDLYGHLMPEATFGVGERLDSLIFGDDVSRFPRFSTRQG
ncbi:MAG: site-specific integrase [Firmicutes bacterium]|nr:site-specific integrase [Bacillota bacterium]